MSVCTYGAGGDDDQEEQGNDAGDTVEDTHGDSRSWSWSALIVVAGRGSTRAGGGIGSDHGL
jgi:hypothetical protein